jgi:predicted  nucleic acid-binding Zn-ribbon protein
VVTGEVGKAVADMVRSSLGLGASGERTFGGGLFSMKMTLKTPPEKAIPRPVEEELRRDLVCPHCGLVHAVFGLASMCPDCGRDIFSTHVRTELAVLSKIVDAVPDREQALGQRVAARDLENALEDVVSIFEAVMKFITRRSLRARGKSDDEIAEIFRTQVRNDYQNIAKGRRCYQALLDEDLFACLESHELQELTAIFEKRHPITHNLGVVDRQYLRRVARGELEGREIRVTPGEVREAIALIDRVISNACGGAAANMPSSSPSPPPVAKMEGDAGATQSRYGHLSSNALRIAEYLVKQSKHGVEHDPTVPLGELERALNIPKDALQAAAAELHQEGCLWIRDPIPNSQDEVAPLPRLFEIFDHEWMGWDIVADAMKLASSSIQVDALIVQQTADEWSWPPRRMNPALEYLRDQEAVTLGPYAYPYVAVRVQATETTRAFLERITK